MFIIRVQDLKIFWVRESNIKTKKNGDVLVNTTNTIERKNNQKLRINYHISKKKLSFFKKCASPLFAFGPTISHSLCINIITCLSKHRPNEHKPNESSYLPFDVSTLEVTVGQVSDLNPLALYLPPPAPRIYPQPTLINTFVYSHQLPFYQIILTPKHRI